MQRVPRWWAGKDPAAKPQISRSTTDLPALDNSLETKDTPATGLRSARLRAVEYPGQTLIGWRILQRAGRS
ncbi:hypothetical protein XarbCFBP7408_03085 [Xanthomonas arboricola pv. guizotiae]|uniref:Uncharacterized protein n=1 Tax=Xanthomonas arboricola pv. guizotiae TaxID=487867 RepID=A0A2S7A7L1_9XANT|nr:hypothetical protein XarbCFBP7409_01560 [Xanthomonas arboricola pv. guizotiae]PPU26634.1 hypothetical protein XarbCFBP7408_03085 [Xanthomonas arboricola pv. guizotiae]